MTKSEYERAVKSARCVFAYIQISGARRQAVQLSKVKAAALIGQVPDGDDVSATWASDDQQFRVLLVG